MVSLGVIAGGGVLMREGGSPGVTNSSSHNIMY